MQPVRASLSSYPRLGTVLMNKPFWFLGSGHVLTCSDAQNVQRWTKMCSVFAVMNIGGWGGEGRKKLKNSHIRCWGLKKGHQNFWGMKRKNSRRNKGFCRGKFGKSTEKMTIWSRWLKKVIRIFERWNEKCSGEFGSKKSGKKSFGGNMQSWIFLKACSALARI